MAACGGARIGAALATPPAALSGSHNEGPRLCRGIVTQAIRQIGSVMGVALTVVLLGSVALQRTDFKPIGKSPGFAGEAVEV